MKIKWTVDLDQGYVEGTFAIFQNQNAKTFHLFCLCFDVALLMPQPGVIAAVSGGVSLGGVIGAGVECEVTIGYKLIPKATIGQFDPDEGGSEYGSSFRALVFSLIVVHCV